MPPPEAWLVVAVGCYIAFWAARFAAQEPPSWPTVAAVIIVVAIAWTFVSFANLQGAAGQIALLTFIVAGAIGVWRGNEEKREAIRDHDHDHTSV